MAAASTSTPLISQSQFTAMNQPQCFYNESIAFFYNRSGKYLATEWNTVSKLVMGLGITVCIFIMLANLLVMVAIYVNRRFHFPIYYLMANLAAADFFAGLAYFYLMFNTGPNTRRLTVSTWLLRQGLIDTSLTASVANLLAIAIERHITVFRMQLHTRMSNRRVVVVIVVIWTMAIVMGAIPSVGWNCICDIENCSNMAPLYSDSYLVFWAIFNLVTFVVMVVLYAHIFGYVRQRTMRMSRHSSGPRRNRDTMMSLLKTVVIVLVLVFLDEKVMVMIREYVFIHIRSQERVEEHMAEKALRNIPFLSFASGDAQGSHFICLFPLSGVVAPVMTASH
ncbi:Lysophosphatidic acid receptor 1 [Sciurus carolinensis]|uniref:Lysophosphatidic acid receptor 1 n=1 Tax=Sciurus carolinensis TaxID=30640 RepID=A0AA41MFU6_SCICA|nr:Lysophosphatidic acid receptor 1 [Sciurus carolinensis]